jgi:hypothetical protein
LRSLHPSQIQIAIVPGNFSPYRSTRADDAVGRRAAANKVELGFVAATDTRELRWLLPPRLVVYFVLACGGSGAHLWLHAGAWASWSMRCITGGGASSCSTGALDPDGWVDAGGGRRWRPPNISSLSRARSRLGADPLHMLFDSVAGSVGAAGLFCCGLRVVSMDGTTSDVPDTTENTAYFGRPANATRAGAFLQVRWFPAPASGTGARVGAIFGPHTLGEPDLGPRPAGPAFGPGMLVLADRNFQTHSLARECSSLARTSCGGPRRPSR